MFTVKIVGKEWDIVATREVHRSEHFLSSDEANESKTRIEEVRGYTPEIEKDVEEHRLVLEQQVDTMDIAAVIKAINKL